VVEEAPVKRKRGRPRKVVVEEQPKRSPVPVTNPQRGKHSIYPGDIVGYSTAEMNYQFKVLRRVETSEAPTWIWGSTNGGQDVDMAVQESDCVLLRRGV